ncbi:hypothetical protein ACWCYK_31185 [Streptomyces lydicamycinicus]
MIVHIDPWVELADSLDGLRTAFGRSYEPEHGWLAASPASQECQNETLAGDWGSLPTRDANITPVTPVLTVLDHLESLSTLFRSPGGVTASHTIARAVLDIAIGPWYLLEPGIGPRERVRRFMNMRLLSLKEQTQLETGPTTPLRDHANNRIEDILRTARTHGFDVHRARDKYKAPHLGPATPSTTTLATEIIAPKDPRLGALFWRLGSAVTHGQQHGLAMFFMNTDQAVNPAHGDSGVFMQVSLKDTALRCGGAPLAAISMLRRLYAQYGWQPWELEKAISRLIKTWQSAAGIQAPPVPETFRARGAASRGAS